MNCSCNVDDVVLGSIVGLLGLAGGPVRRGLGGGGVVLGLLSILLHGLYHKRSAETTGADFHLVVSGLLTCCGLWCVGGDVCLLS